MSIFRSTLIPHHLQEYLTKWARIYKPESRGIVGLVKLVTFGMVGFVMLLAFCLFSRYMMASTPHDWRYPDPPAAASMKPLVKAVT